MQRMNHSALQFFFCPFKYFLRQYSPQILLKNCWKYLPQSVRFFLLNILCLIYARKRLPIGDISTLFVLGAFRSSSGLAQGARLYADKKEKDGSRIVRVDITEAMVQRTDFPLPDGVFSLEQAFLLQEGGTVVIHANPPQFQLVICKIGKQFFANKRIVGYWAWELEIIPRTWEQALDYVDAVEVPSFFVYDALREYTMKEISVVPHEIPIPLRKKTVYAEDGVVRCLYFFDLGSSFERKNPLAVLQAFTLAFKPGAAELTFKVSGVKEHSELFKIFRNICSKTIGVHIITDVLSPEALNELYLHHDIYLSLHRSEGYGLTIREAMLHGLYVVATGWSGNMDFMTGELAYPVPYTLVPMDMESGPCKGLKARWAEADVHAAAEILRGLLLPRGTI